MSRLPSLGRRGEGWFVLQVLLLIALGAAGFLFGPDWEAQMHTVTALLGLLLLGGGSLLGIAAIRELGRTVSPFPRPAHDLVVVEHGVYARLRHPIYAGVIVGAIGWALVTASVAALLLAGALAVLLDLKARREEHWLAERFARYAHYQRRTKRFVPGIY